MITHLIQINYGGSATVPLRRPSPFLFIGQGEWAGYKGERERGSPRSRRPSPCVGPADPVDDDGGIRTSRPGETGDVSSYL